MDDESWYGILCKGFYGDEVIAGITTERLDAMEAEIRKPRFRDSTSMANEDDSIIVQKIVEQPPENAIVFLIGAGKCYPMLRSHKILNTLHQHGLRKTPVVLLFPGTYNEQELILFNEIKDDNYNRAFKLVVSRSTVQRAFGKLIESGQVRRTGGTRGSWIIQGKH